MMTVCHMSKTKEKTDAAGGEGLPFEAAMARVEELVEAMEGDRLPLDDLIRFYEEGTQLIKLCRQRIDEAQKKVELIARQADGSVDLRPVAAGEPLTATPEPVRPRPRRDPPATSSTDDDIPF